MLEEITVSVIASLIGTVMLGVIGYYVFRNDQKNKNEAIDVRFDGIDKDVSQNDKRIRKEFSEQNQRNANAFKNMTDEVKEIHDLQIVDRQKILITESSMKNFKGTMDDFKETMDKVNNKMDTLVSALITNKQKDTTQ